MKAEELGALIGGVFGCSMIIVIVAIAAILWWQIFKKAGYGGPFGLLMLIPLVNIVMLFVLAFSTWPVTRELEDLRRRNPPAYPQA